MLATDNGWRHLKDIITCILPFKDCRVVSYLTFILFFIALKHNPHDCVHVCNYLVVVTLYNVN